MYGIPVRISEKKFERIRKKSEKFLQRYIFDRLPPIIRERISEKILEINSGETFERTPAEIMGKNYWKYPFKKICINLRGFFFEISRGFFFWKIYSKTSERNLRRIF